MKPKSINFFLIATIFLLNSLPCKLESCPNGLSESQRQSLLKSFLTIQAELKQFKFNYSKQKEYPYPLIQIINENVCSDGKLELFHANTQPILDELENKSVNPSHINIFRLSQQDLIDFLNEIKGVDSLKTKRTQTSFRADYLSPFMRTSTSGWLRKMYNNIFSTSDPNIILSKRPLIFSSKFERVSYDLGEFYGKDLTQTDENKKVKDFSSFKKLYSSIILNERDPRNVFEVKMQENKDFFGKGGLYIAAWCEKGSNNCYDSSPFLVTPASSEECKNFNKPKYVLKLKLLDLSQMSFSRICSKAGETDSSWLHCIVLDRPEKDFNLYITANVHFGKGDLYYSYNDATLPMKDFQSNKKNDLNLEFSFDYSFSEFLSPDDVKSSYIQFSLFAFNLESGKKLETTYNKDYIGNGYLPLENILKERTKRHKIELGVKRPRDVDLSAFEQTKFVTKENLVEKTSEEGKINLEAWVEEDKSLKKLVIKKNSIAFFEDDYDENYPAFLKIDYPIYQKNSITRFLTANNEEIVIPLLSNPLKNAWFIKEISFLFTFN